MLMPDSGYDLGQLIDGIILQVVENIVSFAITGESTEAIARFSCKPKTKQKKPINLFSTA